jgi:hypothetical protein
LGGEGRDNAPRTHDVSRRFVFRTWKPTAVFDQAAQILDLSGVSHYDILMAPVDLRQWHFPQGEKIPEDQQKIILTRLREWLAAKRLRTDVDLPQFSEVSEQPCVRAGCPNKALKGSAYCLEHLSLTALRT